MRRRAFISLLGGAAIGYPVAARAQDRTRIRRIGVIMIYAQADPEGQARLSALRDRLHALGWLEANNIQVEVRWAAGDADHMRVAASEFVGMPVDIIVATSTPLLGVLSQLTQTIPIVFAQVADPVASGFVNSFSRPGGNITGFTDFDTSIAEKWIEVLKEAAPFLRRGTVLMDPKQSNHQPFFRVIEAVAPSLNMQVMAAAVRDRAQIEQSILALAGQIDHGLVILPGPTTNTLRDSIIRLAARNRLPAMYPQRYYATEGGLLYYGIDQVDQWPRVAGYVDRILRGEKPGELPVQAPTKYELVVNLKTARALGITIPPSILARADDVIE